MSCTQWRVIHRPEYREDLEAIESWIARDNPAAAISMWLHIDEQLDRLADPNFPRRRSARLEDAFELVAHENYIVYFDQDERHCLVIARAVVHVARQFPPQVPRE
jgi:toxin ParE1/3/4